MEGWVDLGDWLHNEMVYHPQTVTHPSSNPQHTAGLIFGVKLAICWQVWRPNHYTTKIPLYLLVCLCFSRPTRFTCVCLTQVMARAGKQCLMMQYVPCVTRQSIETGRLFHRSVRHHWTQHLSAMSLNMSCDHWSQNTAESVFTFSLHLRCITALYRKSLLKSFCLISFVYFYRAMLAQSAVMR